MKVVCRGCAVANLTCRGRGLEQILRTTCPFCRVPIKSKEERDMDMLKRVEANDPMALRDMGKTCYRNEDYEGAYKYLSNAADLGNAEAHYDLSHLYESGQGVEKDEKKQISLGRGCHAWCSSG